MVNNVKGTHDIFDLEANAFTAVEATMANIAAFFGYKEMRTPVIEHSELFVRGVGESSDIVRKEMYTFLDKGERSLTLRPEFTAGIIRSIVNNKLLLTNELPYKVFYCGPLFRYERPQLGRYRQFNQFGVESVGNPSYINDVEVIILAYTMLVSLGLENVTIKINTLGDDESRQNYKKALKEYFAKYIDKMCPDCKSRYEINPLRILDCKVPEDQEIVKNAPKMIDYISENSKTRFEKIKSSLKKLGVPFEVDNSLVRGLDYYSETVFELHYISSKGNDYGAIGGGGRYDKLVHELGGPDLPGIGFSFGVERVVSVLKDDNLLPEDLTNDIDFYVMPMSEETLLYSLDIANTLRFNGLTTDICMDSCKLSSMFKRAEKKGAKFAVIVGEDELSNNELIIKDLSTGEQTKIKKDELDEYIESSFNNNHCHCHEEGHECHCHMEEK